jgi:hypothetical protein
MTRHKTLDEPLRVLKWLALVLLSASFVWAGWVDGFPEQSVVGLLGLVLVVATVRSHYKHAVAT